ncbi:hypothetical protein ACDI96_05235 [Citrobacter telavivensis]
MASSYTQGKTYKDVVAYHADPVFARLTLQGLSLASDLHVGDVINATGAAFTSTDTTAYVVIADAAAGDTFVIVVGSGCLIDQSALNITDPTALTAALTLITAAGNKFTMTNDPLVVA